MPEPTCRSCEHFIDDPARIEVELPFLTVLGSAYSSVRGDAGICRLTGRFMDPIPLRSCTVRTRAENERGPTR